MNAAHVNIQIRNHVQGQHTYKRLTFYGFHGDWDHISVCFQNTFVNHTEISWKIDHSMQIKFTIGNKNTCKTRRLILKS